MKFKSYTLRVSNEIQEVIDNERKRITIEEGQYPSINEVLIRIIREWSNGSKNVSHPSDDTDSEQPTPPTNDSNQKNSNWEFNFDELDTEQ